jgi:hypothetical protein
MHMAVYYKNCNKFRFHIKKGFSRFRVAAALGVLLAGTALFLYLTRETIVYVSFQGVSQHFAYPVVFLQGESRTFSLNDLPQDVTPEDFTLTDTSAGYTTQGACEIDGLTVTATKAGYIGVEATAKVGRTTYLAGFKGYVAATAPKIICNDISVSGAIPVGQGEPLPGLSAWVDKEIPLYERGPDIKGSFSYFNEETGGLKRYRYSFDQFALRQLKDDYVITLKAEFRDRPFNEIKVKYYETGTHGEMLNYIAAAARYNKPDTSTLENFLKFKGVAQAKRKYPLDELLFLEKNVSGGKYIIIEMDDIQWVQRPGDKYEAVPLAFSIDWGLTSSMPPDRMFDLAGGAQYIIIIGQGKELDDVYSYSDEAGRLSSVRYYQYYYTAELFENAAGKLIYREDTSGKLQPEDNIFAEAEERGGFAGGIDAAREKCREAVMKYIYEAVWN